MLCDGNNKEKDKRTKNETRLTGAVSHQFGIILLRGLGSEGSGVGCGKSCF